MHSGKIHVADINRQTEGGSHDVERAVCLSGIKLSSPRLQQKSKKGTVQNHWRERAKCGSAHHHHPSKQEEEGGSQVSDLGQPGSLAQVQARDHLGRPLNVSAPFHLKNTPERDRFLFILLNCLKLRKDSFYCSILQAESNLHGDADYNLQFSCEYDSLLTANNKEACCSYGNREKQKNLENLPSRQIAWLIKIIICLIAPYSVPRSEYCPNIIILHRREHIGWAYSKTPKMKNSRKGT